MMIAQVCENRGRVDVSGAAHGTRAMLLKAGALLPAQVTVMARIPPGLAICDESGHYEIVRRAEIAGFEVMSTGVD